MARPGIEIPLDERFADVHCKVLCHNNVMDLAKVLHRNMLRDGRLRHGTTVNQMFAVLWSTAMEDVAVARRTKQPSMWLRTPCLSSDGTGCSGCIAKQWLSAATEVSAG